MTSALIEGLGATAIQIPYSEVYTSIASGLVIGNIASPQSAMDQKCYEVADYYNLWPIAPIVYILVINKQLYDSLPGDLKHVIDDASAKYEPILWDNNFYNVEETIKQLVEKGMELVPVDETEINKARDILHKVYWEKWAEEAGENGRKALAEMFQAIGR